MDLQDVIAFKTLRQGKNMLARCRMYTYAYFLNVRLCVCVEIKLELSVLYAKVFVVAFRRFSGNVDPSWQLS